MSQPDHLPSPNELMRQWRPYLFSDSQIDSAPQLAKATFEHHLETLTSRKEEGVFEHFCRKLAEKELCPNLRPQTGPTGGGDSKVDSETYPVAPKLVERWWFGTPEAAQQRWAFAFSAKKDWQGKARSDVASICSTKRDYAQIYFITNQYAPDKRRAKLEEELTSTAGIPVTILDRSWIVEKVYANGHLDMAISALNIEGGRASIKTTGPKDLKRTRELEELDRQVSDPSRYKGVGYQLAEDCLDSALLARSLERPKAEVEARFSHAARLAKEHGTRRQQLRIAYNYAWTCYWWFETFPAFSTAYDELERLAEGAIDADDAGSLQTLWSLLPPLVAGGRLAQEAAKIIPRQQKLLSILEPIAANGARPNNAAEARVSIVFVNIMANLAAGNIEETDKGWCELSSIVDDARHLGDFAVEPLHEMLTRIGENVDTDAFDALFDKVVGVIRERKSDGEAGTSYSRRAFQKLEHGHAYDAVRWFGRAEALLIKQEYRDELVWALLGSSQAYATVGLQWAARNKALAAVELLWRTWHRDGHLSIATLAATQTLVHAELSLGRVPHIIVAISMAARVAAALNLAERNAKQYEDERLNHEGILSIHLLRIPSANLDSVAQLYDTLARFGYTFAAGALLYSLGQRDLIRSEGCIPAEWPDDRIDRLFKGMLDQPAAQDVAYVPSLLDGPTTILKSVVLGCEITVEVATNWCSVGIGESVLGALEALIATSDESILAPHREEMSIVVSPKSDGQEAPTAEFLDDGVSPVLIKHGANFDFRAPDDYTNFKNWLRDTIVGIIARMCTMQDVRAWVDKIAADEQGFARAINLGNALTLNGNVFGPDGPLKVQDLAFPDARTLVPTRPSSYPTGPKAQASKADPKFAAGPPPDGEFDANKLAHNERRVASPIDIPLWNEARWWATLFLHGGGLPPVLGIVFKSETAARAIFDGWHRRWGQSGSDDRLRVAIVTGIDANSPASYAVQVGPSLKVDDSQPARLTTMVSRINRMTPKTTANLDAFLNAYRQSGTYLFVPAVSANASVVPQPLMECALLRRELVVKPAWQIEENDPDIMCIAGEDDPVIPANETNPPVLVALERLRAFRATRSKHG